MKKQIFKSIFTLLMFILLIFSFEANATEYYISSTQGDDSNDGLSLETPFQTLTKLNSMSFSFGDKILFKSGEKWSGMFWLKGSGNIYNPIIIDKYGGSTKPIIDGDGYQASILIYNDEYIEINNIELLNESSHLDETENIKKLNGFGGAENDWGTGKNIRFGIKIISNMNSLTYFRLNNLFIHDIYPSPTNSDNQHKGYGIKFESQSDQESNDYQNISNVIIENCYITKTGHYGLWLQAQGLAGLETYKHDNITIRNNTFFHTGGSGFVSSKTQNLLVENCLFDNSGSSIDPRMWKRGSGYWAFDSKNVIVQESQFLNAHGPQDSYGAHIDFNNENIVFQYNYSYNNEGGFVEILGNNINCGYRYNISVNDGWRIDPKDKPWALKGKLLWVSNWCGSANNGCPSTGTFIYNNTIYIPNTINPEIYIQENTGITYIYNNLIYKEMGANKIQTLLEDNDNTFFISHNLFYEEGSFNFDYDLLTNAIYDAPLLLLPTVSDPANYKLLSGSPAISSGFLINASTDPLNYAQNNGGRDYFGNIVSDTLLPNIGAYNGLGEPSSIVKLNNEIDIEIFPNPTNGQILLKGIEKGSYRIYDLTGNKVKESKFINNNINISELAKGIYIIQFYVNKQLICKRIIKK